MKKQQNKTLSLQYRKSNCSKLVVVRLLAIGSSLTHVKDNPTLLAIFCTASVASTIQLYRQSFSH